MELVGRRVLCVSGGEESSGELSGVARWGWRAGFIRAVTSRHTDSPALAACVEWDGEPSAECQWRRLREEWEVVVLEHELVWAKRNGTSPENGSPQPALVFQPLIGEAHVGGVTLVEFLSDRQLEFYTERQELRPYEGEVDGGNSLIREDPSSHEHIQAWLRHRQLQHILQLGHTSVKGLRVKVFRPESKPQWFHGIVSHHDHNSRTMTVLSDQVDEPLSVDPALVHVLVLDGISQSLLVEDNAATNCKPLTNKISRITMNAGNWSRNTTETDQVCSSRPVQRKESELCRENFNCSPTEDNTDAMREECGADEAREDSSKSKINHSKRKRRKAEDKEEQDEEDSRNVGLKRPKGNSASDQSECSDSEGNTKSLQSKCSKKPADFKTVNNPAAHLGHDPKSHSSFKSIDPSSSQLAESECQRVGKAMPYQGHLTNTPCNGVYQTISSLQCTMVLGCDKAEMKQKDEVKEKEDQSEGASQEDCEAVSALLASQENKQPVSLETACVLLHTSSPECKGVEGEQEIPAGDPKVIKSDLSNPEVITPSCDSEKATKEEPGVVLPPTMLCNSKMDAVKVKSSQSPGTSSSEHDAALVSEINHKTTVFSNPDSSLEVISKPPEVTQVTRLKCSASPQAVKIEERNFPSKVSTDIVLSGFKSTHGSKMTTTPTLSQHNSPSSSTTDTQAQSRTPPQNIANNPNHTPTRDKPTKSPLIIDRNEPFTVYRDPALVGRGLESLTTYIQSSHTPNSLHSKHHLKSSSPSTSSPSLTSTTSHTKIMSPTAHLSPLSLLSQSPLCSTHPSIPHPHLLPSLLPGLPKSSAILAGHAQLGPLGLPPHQLALQATSSLLGQGPGTASLAPMGLYPVLWPTFPNGVHSYSLGIPGSKWTPPETTGISESSLRRNAPSPWVPQTSPVTNAESQGLRPPLPVRPSSTETQRPSRNAQPNTPTFKSVQESERRAFTETQSSMQVPLKIEKERVRAVVGKNGHIFHSTDRESPSAHSKQPQLVYDLTGDCTSCYQEESRRILQESIEVAPFTAKLSPDKESYPKSPTPSLHFKEREKERQHDREMHPFRHSLPPRLQSAQPSPTLTQSSYYTPSAVSVENKASARRAPLSKELYERLSSPNTAASVLSSNSTQSTVNGRPPPFIKCSTEKEEGFLGKITEQLISSMERKVSSASLISVSSSSASSSSRVVPSLHRAPIFHPPTLPIVTSKEAGQGRLSPPTLTPIQPMSLAGKGQHRPPTLMPKIRHGAVAGKRAAPEPISISNNGYDLQRGGGLHNQEKVVGGHTTNGGLVTTQAATASVIVRSSGYMHTSTNHIITERSLSQFQCDHTRTFEALPSTHSNDGNGQCKRGILWTPVDTVHPPNMVALKQDIKTPLYGTKNIGTHFSNRGVKYAVNIDTPHSRIDLVSEQCEKEKEDISRVNQQKVNLLCCPSRNVPHVKKRRAGLAALEPKQNMHAVQFLHTTDTLNATKSRHTCTTHSMHNTYTAHNLDQDKESIFEPSPPKNPRLAPESTGVVANKPGSVAKVQPQSPSAHTNQPAQSNNYHKLKKAWLTRHSEQDRGSATLETAGGSTTLTTTTTVSLPIKQEVNGLEDKWPTQEGKELFLDNRKSIAINRKCLVEYRKPNGSNAKSNTDDKKRSLIENEKVPLEDVKPTMDRNSTLQGKKPSFQNKKLCINIRKPTSADMKIEKDNHGEKRIFQSSLESESGGDLGNESECHKSDRGNVYQSKPAFKKKQNDQRKQREENKKDEANEGGEDEGKLNGIIQTTKEKSQHRLHSNGIPRSVLKDWRKVRSLKQSGEAFLQDDSCTEIGANVQKCRECRLDRSRKDQEPVISPVFCRFYYFRRLSYSKNGVVRVDGFSVVEDTDEEAVRVWVAGFEAEEEDKQRVMELDTAKYILTLIGDKFCQLVKTENTAVKWVKKDIQVMWKRAVRGVREMCDACEATLFNIHWACHKCGFVVCMDCYKARERKSAKDKELYAWVRCVKNQPHDIKNLMLTQIVPEKVLADLQSAMHSIRREYGIPSQCSCFGSSAFLSRSSITNGLLQLSERTQCDLKSQQQNQQKTTQNTAHKISTERKGKLECDDMATLGRKSSSPEQGSTLRDLLTSTAGKLRLGSTGPGIVFAPVYNSADQTAQKACIPNLLDDIIASVVENKIPTSKVTKFGFKLNLPTEEQEKTVLEEVKPIRIPLADSHTSVPHDWLGRHRLLWLKDHRHLGNQRLFKENWTQEQPVLVSGLHKSLNANFWKPEHFSREFSALHSDLYNCRDGSIMNTCVKEFWDGFEDVSKRTKSAKGDPAVYRLKDWPSGEEFLALMPSRYEDVMRLLPVPEYTDPDGALNLASRLPSFFIRPDLGPRLCCAHGVTACPEQDFGTSNLHVEISDTMSILVYVGVAKGNGAISKSGALKLLEREDLDESAKKRLRDPNETPGALWHIYLSKDLHKIQEFLQTVSMERAEADAEADSEAEWESEADPLREGSWYLSPKLRQRLLEEHGVESRTLLQFYGDTVIIPAGALHQVMNLHSCIQVNVDFVSPEHAHNSYYLTQELRPLKDQVNYEDKLQVKNIFYHSVKDAVAALSRHLKAQSTQEVKEEEC